ncbi:MAG: tetratricopeptide repeat protein [Promethearchaeota archaeon]
MSDARSKELLQVELLIDEGKFDEAYQIIQTIEKREELLSHDWVECQLLRNILLIQQGMFEDALKLTDHILNTIQDKKYHFQELDTYTLKATALWRLGRLDEGLEVINKGEQFSNKLALDKSVDFLELGFIKTKLINRKATIYIDKGNLDRAISSFQQCLSILKNIDAKQGRGIALLNIGIALSLKGDLDHALDYFERCLTYFELVGIKQYLGIALSKIGEIYLLKGAINSALNYFRQNLEMNEKIGNQQDIASSLHNIGLAYRQKGLFDRAMEYFEQSLSLRIKIGNNVDISETLFYLISVAVDKKSSQQANQYLKHLQQINEEENIKIIRNRAYIAEALVLKTSTRLRHQAKAEELLETVANEAIVDQELTIIAMLHLSELLLLELKTTGNIEALQEVKSLIRRILDIAKHQYSPLLLIETYLLYSKLAVLDLDLEAAQRFLHQAKLAAETRGLQRLVLKLLGEQESLKKQINIWQILIERGAPIQERLEVLQLDNQILRMVRQRLKITEEDTLDYAKTVQRLVKEWEAKE